MVRGERSDGVRLNVPKTLRDRLCALHLAQHAEMSPDWFSRVEAAFAEGAVFLWVGLGYANYLTLGGQVVCTAPDDSRPGLVESLRAIANIIVRGARELGMPELVDLLPSMPSGLAACPGCGGRRWDDTPHPGYPEGTVCLICSGLGWQPPRQPEPIARATLPDD
jgi:hypothetical protein